MPAALKVEDLTVEVDGRTVLRDASLEVPEGEVHVLLGPNGSGKSSLLMTIVGFSRYKVRSGRIIFDGRDITGLPIHERVRLGLSIAFQNPPVIRGVKLSDLLRLRGGDAYNGALTLAGELKITDFLERDLNLGFSGGEVKRSEILQALASNPRFILLDEPDSGVDVENLNVIGRLLERELKDRSGLLVTHLGYISKYLKPDLAYVLIDGRIVCSGDPGEIMETIMEGGYEKCLKCWKLERKLG
jgi:Fe-S cluster assembly ATP-binding protein